MVKELMPECFLKFSESSLGGNISLCITFATSNVWENNIINNDFGHSQLWLHNCFNRETGEQIKPFALDSSYFGYNNYKTGYKSNCKFRKINKPSDFETIFKAITKFFVEMKIAIDANKP
jgi:hypothetical protein